MYAHTPSIKAPGCPNVKSVECLRPQQFPLSAPYIFTKCEPKTGEGSTKAQFSVDHQIKACVLYQLVWNISFTLCFVHKYHRHYYYSAVPRIRL